VFEPFQSCVLASVRSLEQRHCLSLKIGVVMKQLLHAQTLVSKDSNNNGVWI